MFRIYRHFYPFKKIISLELFLKEGMTLNEHLELGLLTALFQNTVLSYFKNYMI